VAGVPAEIQTGNYPNISQKLYHMCQFDRSEQDRSVTNFRVIIDGVCIGNRIYWSLTESNYK
jgi:hypothetical protein